MVILRNNKKITFSTTCFANSRPPCKEWGRYVLNYIVSHIFKFKNEIYIAGRVYIKDRVLLSQLIEWHETKTGILKDYT